jgi:hypothetical protein
MESTLVGSLNDKINMDSTITGSMNDNINMDCTINCRDIRNYIFYDSIIIVSKKINIE